MFAARLPLRAWKGPAPDIGFFGSSGFVLWISGPVPTFWLRGLRAELTTAERLWNPSFQLQQIPQAKGAKNPWTFRPDDYAPLRWGELSADIRDLRGIPAGPSEVAGLVLDGVLGGLGAQAARVLLKQASQLLTPGSPWLLVDVNGGSLREVARQFRRAPDERGEGQKTRRSAQELRRLVEVAGLGISDAAGLATGGGRGILGATSGGLWSPQLVLAGERLGGPTPQRGVD